MLRNRMLSRLVIHRTSLRFQTSTPKHQLKTIVLSWDWMEGPRGTARLGLKTRKVRSSSRREDDLGLRVAHHRGDPSIPVVDGHRCAHLSTSSAAPMSRSASSRACTLVRESSPR
jgi:hypothetical protein